MLQTKIDFFENVWPANSAVCLRFDPLRRNSYIAWPQSLLSVDSVVQRSHIRFGYERSRVQFPAPGRVFMFDFSVLLFMCFYFCVPKQIICHKILHVFAIYIYLVYLTYCSICYRLYRYKDTDLASLTISFHLSQYCFNKSNLLMKPTWTIWTILIGDHSCPLWSNSH